MGDLANVMAMTKVALFAVTTHRSSVAKQWSVGQGTIVWHCE